MRRRDAQATAPRGRASPGASLGLESIGRMSKRGDTDGPADRPSPRRTDPTTGDLPPVRRVLAWLYVLAAVCLVLAAVLWWQLLK